MAIAQLPASRPGELAAGCPLGGDGELLLHMNFHVDHYVKGFPGACEWLDARQEAVRAAIAELNALPEPLDVPMQVVAAYSCQEVLKAEKAFFATIRKHSKVLKAADKRSRKKRREATH